MDYTDEVLGQLAYNAYGDHVGWKTYKGAPMPAWEKLEEPQKSGWIKAALAIRLGLNG